MRAHKWLLWGAFRLMRDIQGFPDLDAHRTTNRYIRSGHPIQSQSFEVVAAGEAPELSGVFAPFSSTHSISLFRILKLRLFDTFDVN